MAIGGARGVGLKPIAEHNWNRQIELLMDEIGEPAQGPEVAAEEVVLQRVNGKAAEGSGDFLCGLLSRYYYPFDKFPSVNIHYLNETSPGPGRTMLLLHEGRVITA
jgi:hypothetical protein